MPAGRPLKPCGTEAAARRHARNGEPLCDACKRAAAAARALRRTGKQASEQSIGRLAPELFTPGGGEEAAKAINPAQEYPRLYLVLNTVLPLAMPREASSIVREMSRLLQEMARTAPPGQQMTLAEQLEEAKRDAAERRAENRRAAAEA